MAAGIFHCLVWLLLAVARCVWVCMHRCLVYIYWGQGIWTFSRLISFVPAAAPGGVAVITRPRAAAPRPQKHEFSLELSANWASTSGPGDKCKVHFFIMPRRERECTSRFSARSIGTSSRRRGHCGVLFAARILPIAEMCMRGKEENVFELCREKYIRYDAVEHKLRAIWFERELNR